MQPQLITADTYYNGIDDTTLDLFEGQYKLEEGVSYNSYIIDSNDTIALLDTVDHRMADTWMQQLTSYLNGRTPNYLVIHHMEPDHSSLIAQLLDLYPTLTAVCSQKAAAMMPRFFNTDYSARTRIVKEGDTLEVGTHTLQFINAPMIHWPEVIMSYDSSTRTLFSADAFGKFGALSLTSAGSKGIGSIWGDTHEWACEARRYYFNIVGRFGQMVQTLLKKAARLDIETICPLHGPVLHDDLPYFINLYNTWSAYNPETEGVFIAYCSLHGNTEKAAEHMAHILAKRGVKVAISDLRRDDMAEAVEDAFRYDRMLLLSPTYDGDMMPVMHDLLHHLAQKNYQRRRVAIVENGTWAPAAARRMQEMLTQMKEITIVEPIVSIPTTLNPDTLQALDTLADELAK